MILVDIYGFNGLIVFHAPSVCLLTMSLTVFVSCIEDFRVDGNVPFQKLFF